MDFNDSNLDNGPLMPPGIAKRGALALACPWIHLASCSLVSIATGMPLEQGSFEILGSRTASHLAGRRCRLSGTVRIESATYEFRPPRLLGGDMAAFTCAEKSGHIVWDATQQSAHARLETHVECPKEALELLDLESPEGRLWRGTCGTGTLRLFERHGSRLRLVANLSATDVACEWGKARNS